MIWTIEDVSGFQEVVTPAGEPDQSVIVAYLAQSRQRLQPQKQPGVKRWYYLLADDPRVTLATVGMPLEDWHGSAMCMIGTRQIIGEFPGNRHLIGRKGLQLKMQPIAWLKEPADKTFRTAQQALEELSFQVLDLDQALRSQWNIQQKYEWRK